MEFLMKRSCPDEEMVGDYLEGRLNDVGRSQIEEHLSECETCLQEFMLGNGLVRGGDGSKLETVPGRVTRAAVRLVKGEGSNSHSPLSVRYKRFFNEMYSNLMDLLSLSPWGSWRLAPIRGSKRVVSEDLIHLKKTFKEIETEIEIERTGVSKAHIRVKSAGSNGCGEGIRVTLKRGEREISSYLMDSSGYVLFESIPFGHYSLTLTRDGVMLGNYPFEIKETHDGRR